jgi:ribosomal-protein-alanine N-acetyltransferase
LLTPHLRLRALGEGDLDELHRVYTHALVEHWIGHHTRNDVAEELGFYTLHQAQHGWSFWAVEERTTNRFLGDCGLKPLEGRGPEVELGYDLHPDAWGRGLATEAARATVEIALGALALDRVVAVVKPHHAASRRVLEKTGLVHIGERTAYGERLLLYEIRASATRV